MCSHRLWGRVHQRNIQDTGGEVQGTPKGAQPHPDAQQSGRAPTQPGQLQHNRWGGAGHH